MKIIYLILIALILRFGAMYFYDRPIRSDGLEYYNNSKELTITDNKYGYDHWYERTPAYVLYLHLTQRNIYLQILISVLTGLLAFQIHPAMGWIYCFYPNHIALSYQYYKETLLIFFVVLIIRFMKEKPLECYILLMLAILPFQSFGGVLDFNFAKSQGYTWNMWKMWSPSFLPVLQYGEWWNYLLALPYLIIMFLFIRRVEIISWPFLFVLSVSLCYAFTCGSPRYKEILFPAILYIIFKEQKWKRV